MATLLTNLPANADTTSVSLSAALGTPGAVGSTITIDSETMMVISGLGTREFTVDRGSAPAVHAYGAAVTYTAGPFTGGASSDIVTLKSSATPTATERLIRSELTLTGAVVGMGTNSSVGIREAVILSTSASSGFMYGAQGKFVGDGATVDIGSGYATGVLGQLSLTGATVTSGHVAALIANVGPAAPSSALVDLIYAENEQGPINSVLKSIANTTYVFDVAAADGTGAAAMSTTGTAGATATKGWLKVHVNGVVRYIPLTDSVT
jgi:hypothetical protein